MIFWIAIAKFTVALIFLNTCQAENNEIKPVEVKSAKPSKYPIKIHNMFQEKQKRKTSKTIGQWSEWSPWTTCSRSCGGGITQQNRNCITRPAESRFNKRQRRRRQSTGCVGVYKRIRMCNSQDCPSDQDFRREQCAAFNNRLFRGNRYQWEPFATVKDECALNCRAVGMNFFATLNKTVIDGTPCSYPVTHVGKAAPKGSRGICFEGHCKAVNARGVIGSIDDDQEECPACLKGSCRSTKGIYTKPDLSLGYSLVAQVPAGACNILVQQIKRTKNLLALKYSNGSYLMNGDWKFSNTREFRGSGTKFTYVHQDDDSLETLSSSGPLADSVDIMVVNYQTNLGIKYRYSLPVTPVPASPSVKRTSTESYIIETRRLSKYLNNTLQKDEAKPSASVYRRFRRKRYRWKITGLTACSKPCGGGIQAYVTTCVKEITPSNHTPVHERRCTQLGSPASSPIPCNVEPCPPSWQFQRDQCSVTCGEGVQYFIPQCKQARIPEDIQVNENLCPGPKPAVQTRLCQEKPCVQQNDNNEVERAVYRDEDDWSTGIWSDCSVSCGSGHLTRSVTCPTGRCKPEDRPTHTESCTKRPCPPLAPSVSLSYTSTTSASWLITEWSQCSKSCGAGNQTRLAVCGVEDQSKCSAATKPDLFRTCSSDKQCGGHWFTGPWGICSDSCSRSSKQMREVLCVVRIRDKSHITNEMFCKAHVKPDEEQHCDGSCPPHWYAGDWATCEGSCPAGIQRRQVTCLDLHGQPSEGCPDNEMPVTKRTCACQSSVESSNRERHQLAQDDPIVRNCVDRIRKCKVAVQARLCHYPYYIKHCCESCKNTRSTGINM